MGGEMGDIDRITEVLTKALHEAETTGGWWGHPECEEFARIAAPAVAPLLAAAHTGGQESVREAITQPHLRASTDAGPDYCSTCSEAVQDWVVWPCAAVRPARAEAEADAHEQSDRANHWQAKVEQLQQAVDRHGVCTCNTGPGTDGPDEFCPQHGRPYEELLSIYARFETQE